MTYHRPDLGGASDWLKQVSLAPRPIRSTTQIWVESRHQYGIPALIRQIVISSGNHLWRREVSAVFLEWSALVHIRRKVLGHLMSLHKVD